MQSNNNQKLFTAKTEITLINLKIKIRMEVNLASIKLEKIKPPDQKNRKANSKKTGHDDFNLCVMRQLTFARD
jgi:hypothetical protein